LHGTQEEFQATRSALADALRDLARRRGFDFRAITWEYGATFATVVYWCPCMDSRDVLNAQITLDFADIELTHREFADELLRKLDTEIWTRQHFVDDVARGELPAEFLTSYDAMIGAQT
jgi:hypothetical protein